MKYPLETKPFPPLQLLPQDVEAIQTLANDCVLDTLDHYDKHLWQGRGIINTTEWKFLKKRENMSVYQERVTPGSERLISPENGSDIPMQRLLCVGTIDGDLDNLMYGVVNATTESMMIKSSYIHDNVVDCSVLSTIISPSVEDPMRSLVVKWSVNASPLVVRPVVRARDFTYIEATGFSKSINEECVGYHIIHSIGFEDVPQLPEYKLVRGNLSLFHLYRQKSANAVEVFMRGFCDPKGMIHPLAATYSCADASIAIWRTMVCSEMKKLTWMLKNSDNRIYQGDPCRCAVCKQLLRGKRTRLKRCRVCNGRICTRCRVKKNLSFLLPGSRKVISKSLSFCTSCIGLSVRANGLRVAQEELSQDNCFVAYETIPSMSPRSSTSTSLSLCSK